VAFKQSVDDYITSVHSRNGFSRDRVSGRAALQFDDAVRAIVASHSIDQMLTLRIATCVTWGVICFAR
jgi:hypothetical protein